MREANPEQGGVLRRVAEAALKLLAFFVILEPLWMLLPFAGFLYGSGLQIETLGRHSSTAWLTHFVFPVGTLGWFGPVLVVAGFGVFLVGACQIYSAKFRKSGLVTTRLYRLVRHPQYIALTLFGLGLLLAWGRAMMFVAFFVMMFLYYYLARSEERACLRLFGPEYDQYRERTSFVIPGDKLLRPLGASLSKLGLPAPLRVAGAFLLTMGVCFGLMRLINAVKAATGVTPYLTAIVAYGPADETAAPRSERVITTGEAAGVSFAQSGRAAVVRGPSPHAAAPGVAERILLRLRQSPSLAGFLTFLDDAGGDAALIFCAPEQAQEKPTTPGTRGGEDGRRGPPVDREPDRMRLVILRCTLAPGASVADVFTAKSKRQIRGACIAPVNVARPPGEDLVAGEIATPGPAFPGEQRWDFLMAQLAARSAATAPQAAAPNTATSARLVLVQAPVMRTRLDPAFASDILARLAGSARLRDRLRDSGAGGRLVAVAFPRPGTNWYSEHHGTPQISAFVMLARLRDAASPLDDLFRRGGRELVSAFIADVDFKIDAAQDSVAEITAVGRGRDLEERWQFFLSGVGGPTSVPDP